MEFINNAVRILYADWFIPIILVYIALALNYLFVRSLSNTTHYQIFKRHLTIHFIIFLIFLILFYFFIPVNSKIQNDFVNTVENYEINNKEFNGVFFRLNLIYFCEDAVINSYEYYSLKKALRVDFQNAFDKQKTFVVSPIDTSQNNTLKNICEM